MRSLTFLGFTLLGAVTTASILHDGFREASKKAINSLSNQLSKAVDGLTEAQKGQNDDKQPTK